MSNRNGLPKDWEIQRLDEIGEIYSGSTPSTNVPDFWDGRVTWITPNDLSKLSTPYISDSARTLSEKGFKSSSTHLLPARSIVVSSRAPIGYVAIPLSDFCTNQGCKSIELKAGYNSEFVYYNLKFHVDKLKNLGNGTTFTEITKTALCTIELPFPKQEEEQNRIAAVLSCIDRAIEETEKFIAKQQRIKRGLLHDLLTKGIDENGAIRSEATHEFKDSPLGRIPKEWNIKKISNVSLNVVDCPHTTPKFQPSGVLVARTFNIKDGFFDYQNASFVSEEEYKQRITRLEPGASDIIFTREAPVGEAFVLPPKLKICLGQRVVLIRPDLNKLLPSFLVEFLYWTKTRIRFEQVTGGTTNPHLNVQEVRDFKLLMPDVGEQQRILNILNKHRQTFEAEIQKLDKLRAVKKGLMQDLLMGKVRVNSTQQIES